jgi:hypothetical protein
LAHAAGYLGVSYPLEALPPAKTITRLAVLGTQEERDEYLEMLRHYKKEQG